MTRIVSKFDPFECEVISDKESQGIGFTMGVAVAELLHSALLSVNSSYMTDAEFSVFTALKTDLLTHIKELKS